MSFMHKQVNRASQLSIRDPKIITIAELKFSPETTKSSSWRIRPVNNIQANQSPIISHLIPRRGLSFRSDRQKKIQRLNSCKKVFMLQELPVDVKPQTFLNWKERTNSSKKIYLSNDKLLLEMTKNPNRDFFEKSKSQKKIAPINFDLESRKTKASTAGKTKGKSPMELLTRKIQWRGKDVKRMVPYTTEQKNLRDKMRAKGEQRIQKIFQAHLQGWQQDISNQFFHGSQML